MLQPLLELAARMPDKSKDERKVRRSACKTKGRRGSNAPLRAAAGAARFPAR